MLCHALLFALCLCKIANGGGILAIAEKTILIEKKLCKLAGLTPFSVEHNATHRAVGIGIPSDQTELIYDNSESNEQIYLFYILNGLPISIEIHLDKMVATDKISAGSIIDISQGVFLPGAVAGHFPSLIWRRNPNSIDAPQFVISNLLCEKNCTCCACKQLCNQTSKNEALSANAIDGLLQKMIEFEECVPTLQSVMNELDLALIDQFIVFLSKQIKSSNNIDLLIAQLGLIEMLSLNTYAGSRLQAVKIVQTLGILLRAVVLSGDVDDAKNKGDAGPCQGPSDDHVASTDDIVFLHVGRGAFYRASDQFNVMYNWHRDNDIFNDSFTNNDNDNIINNSLQEIKNNNRNNSRSSSIIGRTNSVVFSAVRDIEVGEELTVPLIISPETGHRFVTPALQW